MKAIGRWLCLILVLGLSACAATAPRPRADHLIVGYVAGWKPLAHIDVEKVSALNYAFAHIADGRVALDHPAADFLTQLGELKRSNPRLNILVSVGGWGADGFSDAALSEASRAKFADSAAELLARSGADGIDLDWEYPGLAGPGIAHRAEDKQNFTLLLAALRGRLGALEHEQQHAPYLITAALADSEFVANIELDRVHPYLDWINLMTYDFHNSLTKTTGHHSALARSATSAADERSIERAVSQFLDAGVPARKLVVGVPFYGRAFTGVTPENNGLDQPYGKYAGDPSWAQLAADAVGRNGFVRHWDDIAQAPYLWNEQTRTFVSYDDPESLARKAEFVKAHGLGGMMYWEQSLDRDGELLDVLARALAPR